MRLARRISYLLKAAEGLPAPQPAEEHADYALVVEALLGRLDHGSLDADSARAFRDLLPYADVVRAFLDGP